jgi:flagellar motor switch protein FliM
MSDKDKKNKSSKKSTSKTKDQEQSNKEADVVNDDLSSEEAQLKAFQAAMDAENKTVPSQEDADDQLKAWQEALKSEKLDGELHPSEFLQQDAIDKLFGGSTQEGSSGGSAILLNRDGIKSERFPMLDVVFDKFVQYLSLNLRNFLQTNTETKLVNIRSVTFNDYLNSITLPAMFNLFKIEEWESSGMIMLNNSMIYALINILLGGKKYSRNQKEKIEGRPFSPLEFNLVGRFVHLALEDLRNSFSFVYPVHFAMERQESIPKLIGTISNSSPVIVCAIKIDMGEFNGLMDLVIPHTSLDPIRDELLKKHVGDAFGQPNIWRPFLTQELLNTDIEMSAVLMEERVLLADVLNWKPGTTLQVDMHKLDEIVLRCDTIPLLSGKLGHHNGMVAVEIEDIILKDGST